LFKEKYPNYQDYIDNSVYDICRLFRLPNQRKPIGEKLCELDYHEIIHGSLEESFIQNIDDLPTIVPPAGIESVRIKQRSSGSKENGDDIIKDILLDGFNKIIDSNSKNMENLSEHIFKLVASLQIKKEEMPDEHTTESTKIATEIKPSESSKIVETLSSKIDQLTNTVNTLAETVLKLAQKT
jgi:hypothetical protein